MISPTGADSTENEAEIVGRASAGDLAAFEVLYRRTRGRVMAVCLRMTGDRDRAADLTHDAFVRAWQRLGTFRGEAAFATWMHRLAVNVVLAASRSESRRNARQVSDDDAGSDSGEAHAVSSDVLDKIDLERAIARLPPNARMVFVLHDVEGYKHEEIALQMELAPGTVRAHLHRARQQLMRMLSR